jgi:DNA-binding CsgD family transcriptional regulator
LVELRSAGDAGVDLDAAESFVRRVIADVDAMAPNPAAASMIEAELSADPTAWARAREALEEVEGPVHLRAYAALRHAELLATTDRRHAVVLARSAADHARRLGALPLLARIEDFARRLGEPIGDSAPAPAPTSGPPPLTPRELDVLRLVAEGLSNGEIGQRLFISTKTASVHVSNILAKLGVANRTEAAAAAHRDALI